MVVTSTSPIPKSPKSTEAGAPRKRKMRTTDERIADLEAEITRLREREQKRKAKADPAVRHLNAASRSIEKALTSTEDADAMSAIGNVRAAIASALEGMGAPLGEPTAAAAPTGPVVGADVVRAFIEEYGGQTAEQIAQALGTDTGGIRDALATLQGQWPFGD